MLDGSQVGITMFLGDVRISLADAAMSNGCRQTEVMASAAGSQFSTTLLGKRFCEMLPKIASNPEALQRRLRDINPEDIQGWTEIHRGPETTGFLTAVWSPANHDDTLVMIRSWRGDARGAFPYMISWQHSKILTHSLDDAISYSHIGNKSIAPDQQTIKIVRKVALTAIAAIVAKSYLAAVAQVEYDKNLDRAGAGGRR